MATNEKSSVVLTDAEIKKALKFCSIKNGFICCDKDCPLSNRGDCITIFSKNALDLINRLEADKEALIAGQETLQKALAENNAEIEELTGNLKFVRGTVERQKVDNERLKNLLAEEEAKYSECAKRFYKEGVKEFAERLKRKFNDDADVLYEHSLVHYQIDSLVKEMVGD